MTTPSFNGWKNHQTWNVALWLQNDERLYSLARAHPTFAALATTLTEAGINATPDGVRYDDPALSRRELNRMMRELRS